MSGRIRRTASSAEQRSRLGPIFAVLALSAMGAAVLQAMVAPALRPIQLDLGTSTTGASWILTAFLLSASVATPIAGRLGDMFGKKRLLVIALAVTSVGVLISAAANSLDLLLVGRVLQGLSPAVIPLAIGIIRDEFPSERVPTRIALISAMLGVGGGLGIVVAGPIVDHLSYHWLFWVPLVVIVVATVGAQLFVPESPKRVPGRVDWVGGILLGSWLVALLLAVSQGQSWGWTSGRIVGLFAAAIVLAVTWVLVERARSEPLVDMRMMRLRGVWTTNAVAAPIGASMFASFFLIPQLVELPESTGYGFGASITQAGLFLLPATVAMLLFSFVAGRLTSTFGPKLPLVLGAAAAAASFVMLAVAHSERWEIYAATALQGAGLGLAFSAMANLIVAAVRREQTGVATAMNTIMRTIGGSIGSTVAAVILTSSLTAGGIPKEHSFTVAFVVVAIALVAAVVAALAVPGASLKRGRARADAGRADGRRAYGRAVQKKESPMPRTTREAVRPERRAT
jgi:EmrB/QacA subfamily drug resistance transporter